MTALRPAADGASVRGQRVPWAYLFAWLEQAVPGVVYAPGRWPTADGWIPFRLCLAYLAQLPHLEARAVRRAVRAHRLGRLSCTAAEGDRWQIERAIRALDREAVPFADLLPSG